MHTASARACIRTCTRAHMHIRAYAQSRTHSRTHQHTPTAMRTHMRRHTLHPNKQVRLSAETSVPLACLELGDGANKGLLVALQVPREAVLQAVEALQQGSLL